MAIGRYILRKLAAISGPKNAQMKHAKEVALVYHKLFQLYLTGCVTEPRLAGALWGLTALTLSDFAYPLLTKVQLVEIVFTCAIGCRYKLAGPFKLLSVSNKPIVVLYCGSGSHVLSNIILALFVFLWPSPFCRGVSAGHTGLAAQLLWTGLLPQHSGGDVLGLFARFHCQVLC